jgi:hypothetical protein
VLIDELTYSAAILFATTMQDHGLARLVGRPTGGHANQTGNMMPTRLRHSGFTVFIATRDFIRPSGDTHGQGRCGQTCTWRPTPTPTTRRRVRPTAPCSVRCSCWRSRRQAMSTTTGAWSLGRSFLRGSLSITQAVHARRAAPR